MSFVRLKCNAGTARRFSLRGAAGGVRACWLAASVSVLFAARAAAQTQPGTAAPAAPFEVHGLLYSGSAPDGFLLGDAWARGAGFLGVLDHDGNPAPGADGIPFRASRQVDGNWGNRGDGIDESIFAGSNKNEDLIGPLDSPWSWKAGSSGPQKNDITNAYFHTRVDPVTGDRWVFVAAETRSTNGDSHVDFEFNQAGILQTGTTGGTLIGLGPDGGRTTNDFLISIDFESGGQSPVATVRFWNGSSFELSSFPEAVFSATNFVDIPHGSEGSWKHFSDDGAEVDVLTRLQLVEAGVNLSALGIEVDPCATAATFIVKTRSSSSWTSDLKDFAIVRFPLEPVPELIITAPDQVCRGATFEATVTETTGLRNASLLWEIAGCGAIVSDPAAGAVTVQADPECNCELVLTANVSGGECQHHVAETMHVLVADELVPTLSDEPEDVTVECDAIPAAPSVSASDECSQAVVELSEVTHPGTCVGDAVIARTWTATDECDNATVYEQFVTVQDTAAAVLSGVPADATVACSAIPDPPQVTAEDNCSQAVVDYNEAVAPGSCEGTGTITRTWTAGDECGNETVAQQVLTVTDDTAPVLAGVPQDVTVECDAVPPAAQVTATDDCSEPTVDLGEDTVPGECLGASTVTRTWTAGDACGNADSATQVIEVVDTTPPVLHGVPADETVECDAIPEPPAVTASDNCSKPAVAFEESLEPGASAGKAVITRTWTATDACGNQTAQSQTITVIDTTAPVLSGVPEDVTVECDDVPPPPEVSATDNCDAVTVDYAEAVEPGDCEGSSIIRRTWTATDACGNETTQTQTITLVDRTAPVLSGQPADETAACDDVPEPAVVTAVDNCSTTSVELRETAEAGDCTGSSVVTRTWTATDACGNETTHTQVITVVDTDAPLLSDDPADVIAECDAVPEAAKITAQDACDPNVSVDFLEEVIPGNCPTEYTLHRTWSTADDCGNPAEVEQTVAVEDTTPPVITVGPRQTQYICDGQPVSFDAAATDNCGDATVSLLALRAITATNQVEVVATPLADGSYSITATGPAWVAGALSASDGCLNVSDDFDFSISARLGGEACSQGFWKNHPQRWGPTGFNPEDLFLDAFEIIELSSPEIPSDFNPNITLWEAVNSTSGSFNQALLHGTAALLNAAHPDIEFPATVASVRLVMQAAFAGIITFDEARAVFGIWNGVERECGCTIQ